jgi:hypothetical protein
MSIELDTINDIIKTSDKAKTAPKPKPKEKIDTVIKRKPGRPRKPKTIISVLSKDVAHPLWLSVSEAAKLGGVTTKTIRRAIQSKSLIFRIFQNRYQIDLKSLINYLFTSKKLENKLKTQGIGQYIDKWRE